MDLKPAIDVLAKYNLPQDLAEAYKVYEGIDNIGDPLLDQEHLILFNTLWFLHNKDNQDVILPDSLKMKFIMNRRKFHPDYARVMTHMLSLDINVLDVVIEVCNFSEQEQVLLWKAFHKLCPFWSARESDEINKRLYIYKFIDEKLATGNLITVLDIGCGTGAGIVSLVKRYAGRIRGVGVDFGVDNKKLELGVTLVRGNLTKGLPFPSNFFDIAYAMTVFRYIKDLRVVVAALEEIIRILKKGGVFIFDDKQKGPRFYAEEIAQYLREKCDLHTYEEAIWLIKK